VVLYLGTIESPKTKFQANFRKMLVALARYQNQEQVWKKFVQAAAPLEVFNQGKSATRPGAMYQQKTCINGSSHVEKFV